MCFRPVAALVVSYCIGLAGAAAETPDRLALIIGNSQYTSVDQLANPVNDALLMQNALESAGFSTVMAINADRRGFVEAVKQFTDRLTGESEAIVYYAGHGIQYGAENFLLPTDSDLALPRDLPLEALSLTTITDQVSIVGPRVAIFILDACRNNPLMPDPSDKGSELPQGLAKVTGNLGTYIAFATAPGRIALDGSGRNSPFAQALAYYIRKPGLPIEQVFKRVRERVFDETEGEQVPWDNSSLITDFFFVAALGDRFELARASDPDVTAWKVASLDDSIDAYRNYFSTYPDGLFSDIAAVKIRIHGASAGGGGDVPREAAGESARSELAAWNKASASGEAGDFEAYLAAYPNGVFERTARLMLEGASNEGLDTVQAITTALTPNFEEFAENPLYPEVTECDDLAGHVQEAADPAVGVYFKQIEPDRAVPACVAALEEYPDSLRILTNYARAIDAGGRHDEARALYRVGARSDFPIAFRSLGDVYRDGRGIERDYEEARYWYVRGAERHNVFAQYNLARLYEKGLGVAENQRKAAYWYWRAARQGFAPAMEKLARYYIKGEVLEKDEAQGAILLQGAAEMGHMWSQYGYAELLKKGQGVAADETEARVWMERSARQGYKWAQAKLGLFYRDGIGGGRDRVAALSWLILARQNGLDRYDDKIAELEDGLSPVDVARAKLLASDFKPERVK